MTEIVDTLFSLRRYRHFDAARVKHIHRVCFGPRGDNDFYWSSARCMVIDRARFGVVAFCATCPVLLRTGRASRHRTHLAAIAVLPDFQRFHYGQYLINDALIEAGCNHANGVLQAYVGQHLEDVGAALFFKACGFRGRTVGDWIKFEYWLKGK